MSTGSFVGERDSTRRRSRKPLDVTRRAVAVSVEALESRQLLTTVLSPVADTFIRNHDYANVNFGASPDLFVKNAAAGDSRTALLKFDLSAVQNISSAYLRGTASLEFPEATPVMMNVYPVADTSWVEGDGTINSRNGNGADTDNSPPGEVTWNNAPAISSTALASVAINRYGLETYTWDLTSYLQQQKAAGNNLVSFAFNTTELTDLWTKVLSRESGSYGPELFVNGTGPSAPSSTVSAGDVTNPAANPIQVAVTYSSDQAINTGTLDASNITVSGPAGALPIEDVNASVNPANPNVVTAVYDVGAPAGGWTAADNGLYTVVVQPNQVLDGGGGAAVSSEGQFRVEVGDNSPPTAAISAPDVTAPGGSSYQFNVTFNDNVAIDTSWIDVDNVGVTGPNGQALKIIGAQVDNAANGTPRTATYTVAAPNGTWTAADNGAYTIDYRGAQVRDTAGLPAVAASAPFHVNIGSAGDTTPPGVSISAPDITTPGATTTTVTVVYTDDTAVKAATIDATDLTVTGPAGQLSVLGVTLSPNADSQQITATYVIGAPGPWTSADNGAYTIRLNPGQVTDTSGNAAVAAPASFNVNIPGVDTTPPTAVITAPNITSPGGTSQSITVTYTDNVAVDLSTIGAGNITVTGPAGPLAVTGVHVDASASGTPITAIYTVAAPGGVWGPEDAGNYAVSVVPGSVKDTSGNGVGAASATFNVSAASPDTIPPSAAISAPSITNAGGSTETITIVYTDNVAVNAASIGPANITVSGPSGALSVVAAQATGGSGSPLVAIYTIAAPHGTWSSADNGSYVVALNANQVSDTSGNFAGGASGSFSIDIPPASSGGPPDMTFANGLTVPTQFVTESILTQPDGRVLGVGHQGNLAAGTSQGVIERFNSDGSVDTTFGNGGKIVSSAGVNEAYYGVAMLDASHFVVVGTSGGDFVLARYDLQGRLDGSFGSGGRMITDFGTATDEARGVAIAAGGMIVAAGDSGGNFAFAEYDPNGHLNPNFAQNGRQLFGVGDGNDGLGTLALQSDGKIVAVGSMGANVVVVRLTAAGEADGTFGAGGLVTVGPLTARTDLGAPDRSEGLAIQSNGDILVANRTATGHFGIARLNPSGTLDTTFGTNGVAVANFGGDDDADSLVLEDAGQIIAIGTTLQNGTAQTAVAAFDPIGNPLTSFGSNGLLTLASGVTPVSRQLHVGDIILRAFGTRTSDGRVVIGTTNEAVAGTTSSTLRRIIVPGADVGAANGNETLLGSFGIVKGKKVKLLVTDLDGTKMVITLVGGTGVAYQAGDRIHLVIDDLGRGVTLTITGRGGDGRISLSDVQISGTLKSMTAPNSDLYGTLHATGSIGKLTIGNVTGTIWSGGSIANVSGGNFSGDLFATDSLGKVKFKAASGTIASGNGVIGTVTAASLDSARILSGANLGQDAMVGGTGPDADIYGPGAIGAIKVTGTIKSSFIGAGVQPGFNTFGNSADKVVGGRASAIRSITARSADQASRFEAGAFGKVKLGKSVNVLSDPRFKVL